jgi:hypothetical protein
MGDKILSGFSSSFGYDGGDMKNIGNLETYLVWRKIQLFYDLTSNYFDGDGRERICPRLGYSRGLIELILYNGL